MSVLERPASRGALDQPDRRVGHSPGTKALDAEFRRLAAKKGSEFTSPLFIGLILRARFGEHMPPLKLKRDRRPPAVAEPECGEILVCPAKASITSTGEQFGASSAGLLHRRCPSVPRRRPKSSRLEILAQEAESIRPARESVERLV